MNYYHEIITKYFKLIDTNKKNIFFLFGKMGSGKTFFVKNITKNINNKIHISSPSYSIANEYIYKRFSIAHIDLYKVDKEENSIQLINYYIDRFNIIFVEFSNWFKINNLRIKSDINSFYLKFTIKNKMFCINELKNE